MSNDWTDDDPGERTFLEIDQAIALLQRAKEGGAVYLMCQFNKDDLGLDGLYTGAWHDSNYPGCYRLCFQFVDTREWRDVDDAQNGTPAGTRARTQPLHLVIGRHADE